MYRIVISIIRGTNAGRALSLMANGLVIANDLFDQAKTNYDHYLDCAECILASADKGTCFGTVTILDLQSGEIKEQVVLMGRGTVCRVKPGTPGVLAQVK